MNTSTLDKLRKMKFFGMFHAFKAAWKPVKRMITQRMNCWPTW